MGKITDRIKQGKILVSDGAWGTFLHAKGLKPGQCPELWNIEHAEEVFDIAKSYKIVDKTSEVPFKLNAVQFFQLNLCYLL